MVKNYITSAIVMCSDLRGLNAVHHSVLWANTALLRLLMTVPEVNLMATTHRNWTALHFAFFYKNDEALELLLNEKSMIFTHLDDSRRMAIGLVDDKTIQSIVNTFNNNARASTLLHETDEYFDSGITHLLRLQKFKVVNNILANVPYKAKANDIIELYLQTITNKSKVLATISSMDLFAKNTWNWNKLYGFLLFQHHFTHFQKQNNMNVYPTWKVRSLLVNGMATNNTDVLVYMKNNLQFDYLHMLTDTDISFIMSFFPCQFDYCNLVADRNKVLHVFEKLLNLNINSESFLVKQLRNSFPLVCVLVNKFDFVEKYFELDQWPDYLLHGLLVLRLLRVQMNHCMPCYSDQQDAELCFRAIDQRITEVCHQVGVLFFYHFVIALAFVCGSVLLLTKAFCFTVLMNASVGGFESYC